MIGAPVIARIESAAPPRASLSIRVMHDAGDAHRLVERARGGHRVLPGQCIHHQQGLGRAGLGADRAHLVHQLLVDGQPPGRVEDDDVEHLAPPGLHRPARDLDRGLAGDDRQARDPGLLGELGQLELGRGRCVSRLASSTRRRSRRPRRSASLPAVVVLPEPCKPTIRIGTGAAALRLSGTAPAPPSSSTSTSWTILMTCWPGATLSITSAPMARSRTLAAKSRTTGSATSASSIASRTSRSASVMSASLSVPRLRSRSKAPESLSGEGVEHACRCAPMPDAPLREPSRSGGAPARGKQRGGDRAARLARKAGLMRAGRGTGQARESRGDCGNFAVMTEATPLPQPPPARGGGFAHCSPPLAGGGCGEGGLARAEPLLAFLLALAFYASLYARLPYHDVARFVDQIESNRFVWDIGHIFMQPATLLWHRWLGFGEPPAMSQKHINSFATAAAIGVFYALLMRLRLPAWQRILAQPCSPAVAAS